MDIKITQHPKELKSILASSSYFKPKGAFIAGGALTSAFTGQSIKDVDMYFKTKEEFMMAVEDAYDEGLWCVSATDRAVTFVDGSNIIQFMHFDFFPTACDIFDAFDFTICMAAYDLDDEKFIFSEDFLKHASQRFLRFHEGTRYPYGSLMRVLKYQQRGYTIGKGDLLRIALACQKVPLNSWDDLAKAIGGQYGEKAQINSDAPFSIDAAIELYKETEITTSDNGEAMPGDAFELLHKIGVISGAEYAAEHKAIEDARQKRMEDWGW